MNFDNEPFEPANFFWVRSGAGVLDKKKGLAGSPAFLQASELDTPSHANRHPLARQLKPKPEREKVHATLVSSLTSGSPVLSGGINMSDEETADHPTMELPPQSAGPPPDRIPTAQVDVDLAGQSHQGHIRANNEDHYLAVRITRSLETVLTNLGEGVLPKRFDETAYGMLVADGMGGMAAGEVASSAALLRLLELVAETPDWIMRMNQRENALIVMTRMTNRFRQIDEELREQSKTNQSLYGMGTTLTVSVSLGTDLFLSHIGDSRAYLWRRKKLHQLTKDHTLAQALIDAGIAGPDDTSTRAMQHVLTAALGSTGERADPQVQRLHLSDGDQLLLCTDGLTEMVADDVIAAVLADAKSSQAACQGLIDLALAGGGSDNITVMLARYRIPRLGIS